MPLVIEIIGIGVTVTGILYEYIVGGHIGLITISAGSAIIATGSMLYAKVFRGKRKGNK